MHEDTWPAGIDVSFVNGGTVKVPAGRWHIKFVAPTGKTEYETTVTGPYTCWTARKYVVPWRVIIDQDGHVVVNHSWDPRGREVQVISDSGNLGDVIAWTPIVEEFRRSTGAKVHFKVSPALAELLRPFYPELSFVTSIDGLPQPYAVYHLAFTWRTGLTNHMPVDPKKVPLQAIAAGILNVPYVETRPRLDTVATPRTIEEPYACIAAQASMQAKYWNNPDGWYAVIAWLKANGYRVLCIDRDRWYAKGWHANHIPHGAEDLTGNRPLRERLDVLRHAELFIGLPSGLSWLAWGADVPVVMISGFSLPIAEFVTPYRVINQSVCHGCWNDPKAGFNIRDFYCCPRQTDPERMFECSRKITANQVITVVKRALGR